MSRRSIRDFTGRKIDMEKISMILWAAQGITKNDTGYRTAPSAGALYPIDVYIFKSDGIYKYIPQGHKLHKVSDKDKRLKLYEACLLQEPVKEAPLNIVIIAEYGRTEKKYGSRAIRYANMEAGHVCQNILLEVTSLHLGAVPIGAFRDEMVIEIIGLTDAHTPLYVIPVGYAE
ncbi:MAG: SagB/ThcOx family dehydrogenase [Actinobacteria bacterium]|nr:SagB/ThcOx family dehydrogenase [Actinomycetota bacterium]